MSATAPKVLVPLPDKDFDVTEAAVAWRMFTDAGFTVVFATDQGKTGECDRFLLGTGWRHTLPASPEAIAMYRQMEGDPAFIKPIRFADIVVQDYDAIHLPGGHSRGMKPYLESRILQQKVVEFYNADKTVGAVCHGVLVAARAIDPATGESVLNGRRVTTLTKAIESFALRTTWYRVGRRYRTYRMYTEDEVALAVGRGGQVLRGKSMEVPLVVTDGPFVTARFPGDVADYAQAMIERLSTLGRLSPPARREHRVPVD